ncbi:MAG: transposase zinc-binding domain-containing protein [Rhodocyclaceae bacterium]|nr:transposase zinc-binding domain-containing protein [Rhodocyclaceae bacterium]
MPMPTGKPCPASAVYHRRRPERTRLYRLVQAHLATWLALQDDAAGRSATALTEREFRRYLDCGILAHGFARARCANCGHDFIVAYSCKGRGICPSRITRPMAETAAHPVIMSSRACRCGNGCSRSPSACAITSTTPCCTASCAASNKACCRALSSLTARRASARSFSSTASAR